MSNFNFITNGVLGALDTSGFVSGVNGQAHNTIDSGTLLVGMAIWTDLSITATMSDDINGTWTPLGTVQRHATLGISGQLFYVITTGQGLPTISLTLSGTTTGVNFECTNYSFAGSLIIDGIVYSQTPASGTVATISGLTTTKSDGLLVAMCLQSATKPTVGAGYSSRNDTGAWQNGLPTTDYNAATFGLIEDKVGVNIGAQSATFTVGSGSNVLLGLVAFNVATQSQIPISNFGEDAHWLGGEIY